MNKNSVRNYTVAGMAIGGAYLLPPILDNEYWLSILIIVLIDILLTSSLRLIYLLDQLSLGHVGFSLLGAYSSAPVHAPAGYAFLVRLDCGGIV